MTHATTETDIAVNDGQCRGSRGRRASPEPRNSERQGGALFALSEPKKPDDTSTNTHTHTYTSDEHRATWTVIQLLMFNWKRKTSGQIKWMNEPITIFGENNVISDISISVNEIPYIHVYLELE